MEGKGVTIQGWSIYSLKYADNSDLINKDAANLQAMLNRLFEDSECYGMSINEDKTKSVMLWRSKQDNLLALKYIELRWRMYRTIYVGSNIAWDTDCTQVIKCRIQLLIAVYASFNTIWKDSSITVDVKIKFLSTCVFSFLVYATDTWTLKKGDQKTFMPGF